ncbi:hypothetical protein BDR04DRAFT_999063 [Suillus decipiens]|nr:hypothetical protein BDR04DRAFT_999063 [Suillus decipiens]
MPNPAVAVFSTYDLPRIHYNAADDILWRNTLWTHYWEKDVWVLPIHRPSNISHWVVCIIYLSRNELHLFDSLAEQKPWKQDVKVGSLQLSCNVHFDGFAGYHEIC